MRLGGQKNLGGYIKEISLIPENELFDSAQEKIFSPHTKRLFLN